VRLSFVVYELSPQKSISEEGGGVYCRGDRHRGESSVLQRIARHHRLRFHPLNVSTARIRKTVTHM